MTANNLNDDWWKQAVVYQVYPRSFKDVNGDGLGDIAGVTEKMDYLKTLGIDAIWLSPFYPSDLADGGYDVIDYRNVDPRLGTMDDFDAMAKAAHDAGLKIIVDIVPNHTSNKHVFFQAALAAQPGSAERDRYIFREGRGEHGEIPPNDWQSFFGGPAWERVEDGQWYLHLFDKAQPDLNWKNQDVHEEFKTTLRFWSDHGADGFRIDVAHGLAKDLDSEPLEELGKKYSVIGEACHDFTHPLFDRREVHDIYREWRAVFNEYNPPRFAVAEAWVVPEHQHLYASLDELGQSFNFDLISANWMAADFNHAIATGLKAAEETNGSTTTWVTNNHDVPRSATRYALPQVHSTMHHQLVIDWILRGGWTYTEDRELGTRRARAAALIELGLPGSAYIYQGEELGLFEVADIPWERLEDPTALHTTHGATEKGRDGCRVPLPWDSSDEPQTAEWSTPLPSGDQPQTSAAGQFGTGASFGFSPAGSADPHLPQPLWFKDFCADAEDTDAGSMLNLYRQALTIRQKELTSTRDTTATLLNLGEDVVAFRRSAADGRTFTSVTNFGAQPIAAPKGTVALASGELHSDGTIPQDVTVWILD